MRWLSLNGLSRADSYLPLPSMFIDMTQSNSNNDKESRKVAIRLSEAGQAQGLDLSSLNL